MNNYEKIGKAIVNAGIQSIKILIVSVLGLLLAFPIKWTWNFVIPYLFGLPLITWGKAWCLLFISNSLIKGWPKPKDDA